jgi:hypothetical protein
MKSSLSLSEKYELIFANEKQLAKNVAADVIDKPQLELWMILIPVFFVFYFFHLKRYKNGLKEFIRNFLITRKRVLDATCEATQAGKDVVVAELVDVSDAPGETKKEYQAWVTALKDFFRLLLQAQGNSYAELVKSTYKNRTDFLLTLHKLNTAERTFNKALTPFLPDDEGNIANVVKTMEASVEKFRRDQANEIFM